jgi:uncharacterized membrane protein YgdD (TMEM256/DUF423 family)
MSRTAAVFVFFAGLNGLIAVLGGAWAAHGGAVPLIAGGDILAETGSRFQMWHALALLGLAAAHDHAPAAQTSIARFLGSQTLFRLAGIGFLIGIAGFSGGLYATASGSAISGLAPLGGTAFMVGWLLLALAGVAALLSRRAAAR